VNTAHATNACRSKITPNGRGGIAAIHDVVSCHSGASKGCSDFFSRVSGILYYYLREGLVDLAEGNNNDNKPENKVLISNSFVTTQPYKPTSVSYV
jgi:hypothetical protein